MSPGWEAWANWGLFFLRLGLGLIFLTHGYPKMTGVKSGAKASREGLADSIRRLGLPFPVQFAIVIGTIQFFGGLMLLNKGTPLASWAWRLLPAHVEFLLIGWTAQFILGVGFWILPRFSRGPARGNELFAWLALGLVNAGVCLAGIAPVLNAPPSIALLGRLAEAGAAIAFVLHTWPRVKPLAQ